MAQQTAMQALWEWIDANYHEESFNLNDARDMSLKLEKEQITQAHLFGLLCPIEMEATKQAEQYYNETYNK
jgi:hypothetical protein